MKCILPFHQGTDPEYKALRDVKLIPINKNTIAFAMVFNVISGLYDYFWLSARRFLPVGLFTTLLVSPSVTTLR